MVSYDYASPQVIAPVLGVMLSVTRSCIPVREVAAARKERRLGELNPGPFAAMILNHTGWIVYAVINIDWFIFVMEAIGLLCGIWLTLSLYPLASLKVQNRINGFVLLVAVLYCCLALVTMILNTLALTHASVLMWSWAVSATQVFMCGSPLSTLYKAVRSRSCASFHLGFVIMTCLSSLMWTIYGFAISSLFISVPNLLGGVLAAAALAICLVFPRRQSGQGETGTPRERVQELEHSVQIP